jgi:hypothetical protein
LTRVHEELLCLIRLPLIQVHPPEPDQGRYIVGHHLEHAPERGNRPGDVPFTPVEVREEVRPPRLTRHEPLCVQIGGLGGIEVLAGLQDLADVAIRLPALSLTGAVPRDGLLHGREARTHLLLHGRVRAG